MLVGFCTIDRCVVQIFSQLIFGGKQRQEKQGLHRPFLAFNLFIVFVTF